MSPPPRLTVRHHEARITLNPVTQGIQGEVMLELAPWHGDMTPGGGAPWHLDVGALTIDRAQCDALHGPHAGQRVEVEHHRVGTQLLVAWPDACGATGSQLDQRAHAPRLRLTYHGQPRHGLIFVTEHQQAYTAFSTSQWLPTQDSPDVRATLDLTLMLPRDWMVTMVGEPVGAVEPGDDQQTVRYRLTTPMPSYLYGFAAGRLREVVERPVAGSPGPVLQHLGPHSLSESDLGQIFADTRRMIRFFEDRAGVRYPFGRYSQVLLNHGAAQEAAGLAFMSEGYGRRVLGDRTRNWLAAHELAHQWWGNGLTNRAWTQFWLNEGIASFMTAACLEHLHGRQAYDQLMGAIQAKVASLKTTGADKPLNFPDWNRPTAADRSVVYDKGALFVHELRVLMGDEAFWRGMRSYTQTNWGRSVGSSDFQQAMQAASAVDLNPMFNAWVYGAHNPP